MKYVRLIHKGQQMMVLAEDDPEIVLNMFLDELNKAKSEYDKEYIEALIKTHADTPLCYINKEHEPIPYDETLCK